MATSFALMVCTYQRPQLLKEFLDSAAQLDIPTDIDFHLIVADNNPQSAFETYISAMLAELPFQVKYGHEAQRGYSSARNKAIELALETPAQIMAFCDDDFTLAPDWVEGHLKTYLEFDCDVVSGKISGRERPYKHGQTRDKCGTGNCSFRRALVAEDGLGLRFDNQFNELGHEDQAFFLAATTAGKVIVVSDYPVQYDASGIEFGSADELYNKALVSAMETRSKVVRLRKAGKPLQALVEASKFWLYGLKSLGLSAESLLYAVTGNREKSQRKRVNSWKERRRMTECVKGLFMDEVARQDLRRNH